MTQSECFQLGAVVKTHGLNGNVTVNFSADDPQEFSEMESVFLEIKGKLVPFFISSININNRGTGILKFDYIDNVDEAKEIVGSNLFLPLECMPELTDDEFYFNQIIGFTVLDEKYGELGIIEDIIEYPKNQLFKIDHNGEELLIPVADDFITGIDKSTKTITLTTPEGLLDLR